MGKISANSLLDDHCHLVAEFPAKPCGWVRIILAVIAPTAAMAKRDNVADGVRPPARNRDPVVLRQLLFLPTNGTAMAKIFQAPLPIGQRKLHRKRRDSGATPLSGDGGEIAMSFAVACLHGAPSRRLLVIRHLLTIGVRESIFLLVRPHIDFVLFGRARSPRTRPTLRASFEFLLPGSRTFTAWLNDAIATLAIY